MTVLKTTHPIGENIRTGHGKARTTNTNGRKKCDGRRPEKGNVRNQRSLPVIALPVPAPRRPTRPPRQKDSNWLWAWCGSPCRAERSPYQLPRPARLTTSLDLQQMAENISRELQVEVSSDTLMKILPLAIKAGAGSRRKKKQELGTKEGGNGSYSRKREEKRGSDSRKREETSPFLTTRKPPGEIGKCHQCQVPNRRARRNVGRWKGQPAGLCPVLKTCPHELAPQQTDP